MKVLLGPYLPAHLESPACLICVTAQRMIRFVLMVNRQGQTRLSRYYHPVELSRRAQLEADVVRCCLGRTKEQVT